MSDKHPGVGPIGRAFLAFFSPASERGSWFGPASSWTQRKTPHTPDGAYAPPIIRQHREWPGAGQERPFQPWPGDHR